MTKKNDLTDNEKQELHSEIVKNKKECQKIWKFKKINITKIKGDLK